MKRLASSSALIAATLGASNLLAIGAKTTSSCSITVPDKDVSGDNWYGSGNFDWCRQNWLNGLADGYGMTKEWWDSGFGWTDACNTNLPFGRLATVKAALQVSSTNLQRSGTIDSSKPYLDWASLWTVRVIDDLRARCGGDSVASQVPRWPASDYIRLNVAPGGKQDDGWFYGYDVVERASILIHETKHQAGGYDHREDGKDRRFSDKGAYRQQILWLWSYAAHAANAPRELRCSAQQFANGLLAGRFVEESSVVVSELDCDD